jgi:hypothetical protein
VRRKGRGTWRDAVGIAAAPGRAKQRRRRRKEGGGEEADRWGQSVSERKEKEKGRPGRGLPRGVAGGPLGRRARKEGRVSFSFFLFFFFKLFSKQSLNSYSNQISFKSFTKFYNLFKSHTSNQKSCKAK